MTQAIDSEDADLFDGFGNGSLHLYAVSTPGWIPYQEGDARYLNLDFHCCDWEALMWNALLAGKFKYDEYVKGEDVNELQERNRKKFQQSIPDYPMLARIFDMYEDYIYTPEEVIELHDECVHLKTKMTEPNAIKALRKLIYACNEVSKSGCNLMFVCD